MTRVGLISDLHGNAVALRAVLGDLRDVDRIVCLGDCATLGPHPREVLAMLRDAGIPCVLGNHDDFLLDPALVTTYTQAPIIVEAVAWCAAELGADDLAFVRTFVAGMTIDLDGATLALFHGSPRSHMEDLLATTPDDALDEALGELRATVMAGGHTHLPMLRQHRGALLVNPGSVGMPFERHVAGRAPTVLDHAEYAIVEGARGHVSVTLRRVALDRAALRAANAAVAHPLRDQLARHYA